MPDKNDRIVVCDYCNEHVELKTDIKWIKRISIAIFLAVVIPLLINITTKSINDLYADPIKREKLK